MTTILISPRERGQIRVFAINRPSLEIAKALSDQSKPNLARDLLNAPDLDTSSTEIFPISDLAGVGLAAYLSDGYAVDDAQLTPDRSKLAALDGYVLLLFSDSFGGAATTLSPGPDLTLIGSYGEVLPDASLTPLDADSAQPYSGIPGISPPTPPHGAAGSVLTVVALAIGLALLLWWLLT